MKQINIKVYPNGMTSCNPLVMNFDRENNTTEIIVDYSEVDYLDWIKQLDLVFADGTHTYIEGTSNTLTVPLLEEYLKQGIIGLQPLAKQLVVDEYEKVKWQIANITVRESLNVLENDTSITPSIAEQWEIRIQAVEDAEVVRQENENIRILNENNRIDNEDERITNEQGRVSAENTRVSSENTRISNENTRISNENTRIASENARNVFQAYNGSTSYVVGNKVAYNGSSYVCIQNSLGNLPTNTSYWLLIASKGDQGIQGLKGNQWKGAYNAGTKYVVDDVVSYNGSSYICILASLNNLPTNTTYFSLFAQKGDNTTASSVTNTPSGNISSTTVQGAINELDTEKATTVHTHDDRYYTETEVNTLLNTKANITQNAWITPTLLNGATHADAGNPLQYFIDNFGIVHFRNKLTLGTPSSAQFVMPVGFRPLGSSMFFPLARVSTATAFARADFSSSSGNVTTYEVAGQQVDFASVSYRAVA